MWLKTNIHTTEMIHHLLDAAMAAPSAGNQQPWHFVVVTNNDVKAKLATVSPYATPADKAPVVFALCNKKSGNRFEGCVPQDMSAAAENLLLAVTANDLGAVWMGIAPEKDRITQYASKAALVLAVSAMGATTAFAASNTQGTANNANTAYKGTVLVVASSEDKLTMADGSAMNVGFYLNE